MAKAVVWLASTEQRAIIEGHYLNLDREALFKLVKQTMGNGIGEVVERGGFIHAVVSVKVAERQGGRYIAQVQLLDSICVRAIVFLDGNC